MMADREDVQTCSRCKTEKPFYDFYKNSTRKRGIDTVCKQCRKSVKAESKARIRREMWSPNDKFHRCIDPALRIDGMQRFGILPTHLVR